MSPLQYPNKNIHNKIIDVLTLDQNMQLNLFNVSTKKGSGRLAAPDKKWTYVFGKNHSATIIEVSVTEPLFLCHIHFIQGDKHFSFESYLSYIKSNELKLLDANLAISNETFQGETYISEYLNLFAKHLVSDLRKIATGETWIDVPVDYMGSR